MKYLAERVSLIIPVPEGGERLMTVRFCCKLLLLVIYMVPGFNP
jgi:hypothetical protein